MKSAAFLLASPVVLRPALTDHSILHPEFYSAFFKPRSTQSFYTKSTERSLRSLCFSSLWSLWLNKINQKRTLNC
jgi:hypothetical protein